MGFDGFPAEAFSFYARLAADNSRAFWAAHKNDYDAFVREPVRSLTAGQDWPAGPSLGTRQALTLVRQTWVQLIPLCDWLSDHVGPPP